MADCFEEDLCNLACQSKTPELKIGNEKKEKSIEKIEFTSQENV